MTDEKPGCSLVSPENFGAEERVGGQMFCQHAVAADEVLCGLLKLSSSCDCSRQPVDVNNEENEQRKTQRGGAPSLPDEDSLLPHRLDEASDDLSRLQLVQRLHLGVFYSLRLL